MKITFVQGVDEVRVLHDGELAWEENSWGYIDQYLQFFAPSGEVTIEYVSDES